MTAPPAPTRRALAGPASVAALTLAAGAVLSLRDPRSSSYFPCPIHALTGFWCPGCGATRAFGALVRGDIPAAVSSNVLAVVVAVIGVVMWAMWARARARDRPLTLRRPSYWVVGSAAATVVLFTVFRNIPAGSWLAP